MITPSHPQCACGGVPRRDFLQTFGLGIAAWCLLPSGLRADPALASSPSSPYLFSRPPLKPVPYVALPLGSVEARGWLLKQLELQRDGLTGRADELPEWLPDVRNSAWVGGTGEKSESGVYYLKGLLPLAYILNDDGLKKKAQRWIEVILGSQKDDGFFGPAAPADWWARMIATYVLRDYHEATGDPRVIPFLSKYYGYVKANLAQIGMKKWSKARAADEIDTVLWLYNRTGEASLLSVAALLRDQAYDWPTVLRDGLLLTDNMLSHNVNVPQALKNPALRYVLSGNEADREALRLGSARLDREHGLGIGISSGTEHVSGTSPSQGVETCSIVEKMLSLETNLCILGEAPLGDELERVAFNVLPASLSDTIKQHVYYTVPNHPVALRGKSGLWQDHGDDTVPAPKSGFPCCCYNLHMGWPKYVQNAWAATADGGLVALAYGPNRVTAKVGTGASVSIVQETDYPFGETIRLKVETASPARFPLELRIPGWCQAPSVTVSGQAIAEVKPGTFARIERQWANGDEVLLQFPMPLRVEQGPLRTAMLVRGPLIYSLRIDAEKKVVTPHPDGFDQYELTARSPWNYALALDPARPEASVSLDAGRPMPANPFVAGTTPVRLAAKARRLPSWTLDSLGLSAYDPPYGPVSSTEPEETVSLIPFGCQFLRITHFPVLGPALAPAAAFADDYSGDDLGGRWMTYAGGWYKEGKDLVCLAQHPSKLVALTAPFSDLRYDAVVSAPAKGTTGVLFRLQRPGMGDLDFRGYYAGFDAEGGAVVLGKSNGVWSELKRAPFVAQPDKRYSFRIVATGPKIAVYVDDMGNPLLEAEDGEHVSGGIGLRHAAPRYAITRFGAVSAVSAS